MKKIFILTVFVSLFTLISNAQSWTWDEYNDWEIASDYENGSRYFNIDGEGFYAVYFSKQLGIDDYYDIIVSVDRDYTFFYNSTEHYFRYDYPGDADLGTATSKKDACVKAIDYYVNNIYQSSNIGSSSSSSSNLRSVDAKIRDKSNDFNIINILEARVGYSSILKSGVFLLGGINRGNDFIPQIIKQDRNGNVLWKETYAGDGDNIMSISETKGGGYIIGYSNYFELGDNSDTDFGLIKISPKGKQEWNKYYSRSQGDYLISSYQTNDDGYIMIGSTYGGNSEDILIIKADKNGEKLWEKIIKNKKNARSIYFKSASTLDGGVVIASHYFESNNIYIDKFDLNGNKKWSKTYPKHEEFLLYSVTQTKNGGFALIGTVSEEDKQTTKILKFDKFGNKKWSKVISSKYVSLSIIKQTFDGGFILAGTLGEEPYLSRKWFYVIKTDKLGNVTYQQKLCWVDWGGILSVYEMSNNKFLFVAHNNDNSDTYNSILFNINIHK